MLAKKETKEKQRISELPQTSNAHQNKAPPAHASYLPVATSEPPLPDGWELRFDFQGRKYYVDHINKKTSWNHPSSVTAADTNVTVVRNNSNNLLANNTNNIPSPSSSASLEKIETLQQKLTKKSKKLKEARARILYLERKANFIKGIGIDELEIRELENLIVDFEATLILSKQKYEHLKHKSQEPGANDCKICFDRDIDCVLLNCAHQCCCTECAKSLKQCPICRQNIARVLPTYKA